MKNMTKELQEALGKDLPDFVKAVDQCVIDKIDMMIQLEAFKDEPVLLYTALWYANQNNVQVIFMPSRKEEHGKETKS